MKNREKIIAIVGQTAVGKTALAVALAKKINGEIVSADSRQLYKGLTLLSGQPTKKELGSIPHHLIGTENPKKVFSVAEFQKKAYTVIDDILERGKVPVVVGGTGLYVDAIIQGSVLPEVPPNKKLRKRLEQKPTAELFKMLSKLDPRRAKDIDAANPVRLIRAIEIATALGNVPSKKIAPRYTVLAIGINLPEQVLKKKIVARIEERIKKGMLREAAQLHKKGLSLKRLEMLGLECKFAALYLRKKISKQEFLYELAIATWQYAKRQKTWFQRNKDIFWINGMAASQKTLLGTLRKFLKK